MGPDGKALLPTEYPWDFPAHPDRRVWKHGFLLIIASHDHGKKESWRHVSVSHPNRYPTWDEIMEVRNRLFADNAVVVQFLVGKEEHLSVHPNCFHLWERLGKKWKIPS